MWGYVLIVTIFLLQACGSTTNFAGQYKKLTGKKEEPRASVSQANAAANSGHSLALSCLEEAEGGTVATSPSEGWLDLEVDPLCPVDEVLASSFEEEKVANIVFVIDITGSMQDNIDTVSQNIIAFANELTLRKWQVNFAAVLFKDQIWKTLPFSSAAALSQQLRRWPAEGGGINHPQEAGLIALERASELLANFSKSSSEYQAYKNIVLYVSDAPAYDRNDRDFSSDRLSSVLRENLAPVWENFRLYYSVSDHEGAHPVPNPLRQMEGLASSLNIAQKPLPFPLSKDTLMKQFLGEFDAWTAEDKLVCYLQDASLVGPGAEKTVFEIRSHTDLAEGVSAINRMHLTFAQSPASMAIEIKRCCTTEDQMGSACIDEVSSRIAIEH